MHERTKRTAISKKVKKAVWQRDGERCLVCGKWVSVNHACAHYIGRAQGGLGIEENILTLCPDCHRQYDNGYHRDAYKTFFARYLESKYIGWNEQNLIYDKWKGDF